MIGRLLVGFVWPNLQFSVSWLVDFQWDSCGSIFSLLCHGRQTFSGVRVAQSLVFCVMVGRLLVGFVWLKLQFSVSWQVDFQWGSCGSIFSFLRHGWLTFSGVRVAQSFVFCVMVGRLLMDFVCLNLQSSVSWLVDFQWGSCGSIFSFLCHGWQTFSGLRVAQSLDFCVMVGILLVGFVWFNLVFCIMVGRLLVGFVWLNLQFSVSWQVYFQRGSSGSIFSFLCHGWQTFSGVRVAQSLVLCHGWQIFSRVRVAQSLVFCVMVGSLLVGFVWPNLQFSVSWLVDFQWDSCGSIFSLLCHGRQTFSGVRVAQSLVFCVMVGRLLVGFVWFKLQFSVSWQVDFQWGSCGSIFSFLCHGWQTFSGIREAQSLVFCVKVGDFQWGSCGSISSFMSHGWQTFSGVSCGSIFSFLRHGWQTFSGVRVAQSFVFCVMVGRLLMDFACLNLQLSVSWLVDFQWGSRGSIFCFLCHGWQTFSGLRVAQSLDFCVMVGILLVGFVWLNLVFCIMVGRLLVGFVWLNLQFSVSWQVYFQRGSSGSIFSFLCHGWQTFSGVRVAQSLVLCHGWQIFSRVRVAQSLVFCVMVGRLLVGFVWPNLQFSVSWLVDFQWDSCGSIFSLLCHGRQTFSGVRVAQSLVFCVMVGRLLVGFVWFKLQFSVSWQVDFQWGSCGSIFSFLCHGWQTFSGIREAQSLVFCVKVGDFQWGSCGSISSFLSHGWQTFSGVSCGSIFSFLRHGWQTFSGVRVAQSFVFCVMVGRLLMDFACLNLQLSVSWLVDFQWGSCGSIFCFLCHGWQTFSGLRVAQSLDFCVMVGILLVGFVWLNLVFCIMVGRLLVGFVWLNLQFSVLWQVYFQRGSSGSIFSFLCHGWQTFSGVRVAQSLVLCHGWQIFSGVRVAQSLVFCVMVDRLLVGFVWFNLQFSVS